VQAGEAGVVWERTTKDGGYTWHLVWVCRTTWYVAEMKQLPLQQHTSQAGPWSIREALIATEMMQ